MLATYFYLKFLEKKTHTIPNWFLNMKHILKIGQFLIVDKNTIRREQMEIKNTVSHPLNELKWTKKPA